MAQNYLFTSDRLGFRNWIESDIPIMATINADPKVMEFFPKLMSLDDTIHFLGRMQKEFEAKGFCYYAVDILEKGTLIGFIGLHEQTFEADFNPCIDIGWRLGKQAWNKGYATEGAKRCLQYGFENLGFESIKSMAPIINTKSIKVMQKIGMEKVLDFEHPKLYDYPRFLHCALYQVSKR